MREKGQPAKIPNPLPGPSFTTSGPSIGVQHIGDGNLGCQDAMPDAGAQGLCWAVSFAGGSPRLPAESSAW